MSDHTPSLGRWASSTLVGFIAAVPLVGLFASIGEAIGAGGARVFVALGVGAGIGLAQSLSNGGTVFARPRWAGISAVGLAIPALVADLTRSRLIDNPYELHVCIALGGVTLGVWQAILLRRHFENAAIWVPACIVGWTMLAIGSGSADIMVRGQALRGVLGAGAYLGLIAVGALALGVVTGFAASRMRARK